jgi:hypothetical protein
VTEPGAGGKPERDRVELVATALLALAAVATAWSSYQATRWNGEQAKASGRTNGIRIEAARAAGLAEGQTEIDVATFIQWVDAHVGGESVLEAFYADRFRAEFEAAFNAWVATEPFTNPGAPPTPFAMPEYQLAATADAERLDRQAEVSASSVARNVQRAANYVLGVVLFSVALFFAGISTKLQARRLRIALLVTGCAVFVGTAAWLATFPIRFSVS